MNLFKFLESVDKVSRGKSKEELECFIHELARGLNAGKRDEFLYSLQKTGIAGPPIGEEVHKSLVERYYNIRKDLMKIKEAELVLDCEMHEVYHEWYRDYDYEYTYHDYVGIGNIIENACELLHNCTDHGEFAIGCELADLLMDLEIFIDGEEWDGMGEPLRLADMQEQGLAQIDYKAMVILTLYMTYVSHAVDDRPTALYQIFSVNSSCEISLEDVMQAGEELQEFDVFLNLWVRYLGNVASALSQRLLEEAIGLFNDETVLLEYARKFSTTHPELYERYFESQLPGVLGSKKKSKELYDIGQEALASIDIKYVVRSHISLMMLKLAECMRDAEKEDYCMVETFRSDTTVANYLRIRLNCHDYNKCEKEIADIYQKHAPGVSTDLINLCANGRTMNELTENKVGSMTAYMLAFLKGDFDVVLNRAMNIKQPLGWSGTFMKCGLAVFLLLLYDAEILQNGGEKMSRIVMANVKDLSYEKDISTDGTYNENHDFWQVFLRWKKSINLSSEQRIIYLSRIEQLISMRVQGIMEANKRNYYDECASYVAALGEVKESLGLVKNRQVIMEQYRAKYPRRSAFRQALRD